MKLDTRFVVSLLALGALLGATATSRATDIAELPLKASVLAKPNVIIGYDDSGSMDAEVLLNTADGVFWWNFNTGNGWDASGNLHRHVNLGEYWSSTWRRYFYLFPNGNGGGLNLKPDNAFGDWSLPPTSEFGWARSAAYNPQFYNPAVSYKPWATAYSYAAFAGAAASAARGHPIYGGATNVVDLGADRAASTSPSMYFIAVNGMTLPAGASVAVCDGGNAGCSPWAAVGSADTAAPSGQVTRLSMAYWPATYWVKASGSWDCTLPSLKSVGTDDCALAPDGQKLRRIEIRAANTAYPSGRSYAEELQNFANWFQYHRKRRLSANAAMGEVLESLTGLRIGAMRMNALPADGTRIPMYNMDSSSAANNGKSVLKFLYEIDQNVGTPTRQTLRRVGHEFLQSDGPIQYACQRNVGLIVTDGYASATTVTPPSYSSATWGSGVPQATTYGGTLADIALSYYTNTLGDSAFPVGKVPVNPNDANANLHMNTYALTLGAQGDLFKGETTPLPTSTAEWVNPSTDFNPSAVDDLWHATINGRGKMYLATAASETAIKLQSAFSDILSQTGAQGGIAVSTVNLPRGDDKAYFGTYNPAGWAGDLTANAIDPATGSVTTTATWSASAKLLARDWTTRVIATSNGSSGMAFTAANVGTAVNPGAVYGTDAAVVDYLRGDRSGEGTAFRTRTSLMGAVINSEPVVSRDDGVVYVSSGEGMLHAFDTSAGSEGDELWAFVPSRVLPNIGESAERGYVFGSKLDGSPVVGKFSSTGKLLVAGMGVAGRGYFALDVSNPRGLSEAGLAGKLKWEFPAAGDTATQAKVGQTLGRPVIVKTAGNGYVVLLSSGYNNTADGKGRLWMLNADTGALLKEFEVNAGTLGAESGLAHVAAFAESNATVQYVYGGDLLGNVWSFDLSDPSSTPTPKLVATLIGPSGQAQPVTAAPELLQRDGKRIVFVGTGRLLDIGDFGNSQVQTIYAIADGTTTLTNARSSLVQQTYDRATDAMSANDVDWSTQRGWYVDLPAGEQINTRPTIAYGGLAFISNVNGGTNCMAKSYLYVVDALNGKKSVDTAFVSTLVSDTSNSSGVTALLTTGPKIVGAGQDADGKPWEREITSGAPIQPGKNAWIEIRRQ